MTCLKKIGVAALLSVSVLSATANASTIRSGFNAMTLSANDDGSTGEVSTGFEINFFGETFNTLFVNNNGNVTFDSRLNTFTPFDLTSTGRQIIAPFFADVDTNNGIGEEVTYGTGTVDGTNAFGVNWIDVNYYDNANDNGILNSFQLVLIDRSDIFVGDFDIEFNYGDILWETGEASGSNLLGLGGDSARVGYSNGTGEAGTLLELEGSAVNGAFINGGSNALNTGSNIGEAGRYVFSARSGNISNPPVNASAPSSVALLGLALFALGMRRRMTK
ncbi:nidogen-like domain-containing protein [Glaciecola sp. 2405UD65-10]|uniref:nidogen-like domain-containing protein n=1 Tax=Glaciecola sp. 2405UD65-10 TaxID=3397244 RepID=UPI003B59FFB9